MQHPVTDLTLQQLQAIEMLTRGQPIGFIASEIGVSRETIWRWRQQEPFSRILQQRRRHLYNAMQEQAVEMMRLAMVSINRQLKPAEDLSRANPVDTALKVMRFISNSGLAREAPPELYPVYASELAAISSQSDGSTLTRE